MEYSHTPVLFEEAMEFLSVPSGGRFIDGTVGGGGHASGILTSCEDGELLGIDRDRDAVAASRIRLARFGRRVTLVRGRYSRMEQLARAEGWNCVSGILLDLGVSSHQIDDARRGFSFRSDGPLDMRMDRRAPKTASTILNHSSEKKLTEIFRKYGEERHARRVARAVVERRTESPFSRTTEFADLLDSVVGRHRSGGLPAPTRCFQALRIAVNRELEELRSGLEAAIRLLEPEGRLVVISFHSLEDRIVKHFLRAEAATCTCPPDFPECICEKKPSVKIITRKPVRPSPEEIQTNPRASSAKMRAGEKLP